MLFYLFWSVSEPWHLLSPLFGKNFPKLDGGKKGERKGRKKRKKERRKEINYIALLILKSAQISEMLIRNASPEYPVWNSIHMTTVSSSALSPTLNLFFFTVHVTIYIIYCLSPLELNICSIHCCVFSTYSNTWHIVAVYAEWMNEWINEQQQQSHFDITFRKTLSKRLCTFYSKVMLATVFIHLMLSSVMSSRKCPSVSVCSWEGGT